MLLRGGKSVNIVKKHVKLFFFFSFFTIITSTNYWQSSRESKLLGDDACVATLERNVITKFRGRQKLFPPHFDVHSFPVFWTLCSLLGTSLSELFRWNVFLWRYKVFLSRHNDFFGSYKVQFLHLLVRLLFQVFPFSFLLLLPFLLLPPPFFSSSVISSFSFSSPPIWYYSISFVTSLGCFYSVSFESL